MKWRDQQPDVCHTSDGVGLSTYMHNPNHQAMQQPLPKHLGGSAGSTMTALSLHTWRMSRTELTVEREVANAGEWSCSCVGAGLSYMLSMLCMNPQQPGKRLTRSWSPACQTSSGCRNQSLPTSAAACCSQTRRSAAGATPPCEPGMRGSALAPQQNRRYREPDMHCSLWHQERSHHSTCSCVPLPLAGGQVALTRAHG
jgi:hypothetical protein